MSLKDCKGKKKGYRLNANRHDRRETLCFV